MTYLIYTGWTLSLILLVGEVDRIFSSWLLRRFRLPVPDIHWAVTSFIALLVPGSGQFLNGQPIKAAFVLAWPLLIMFRSPVPPPWQMLLLKTGALLAPWWFCTWLDATVTGWLVWRARHSQGGDGDGPAESARQQQIAEFLARRKN